MKAIFAVLALMLVALPVQAVSIGVDAEIQELRTEIRASEGEERVELQAKLNTLIQESETSREERTPPERKVTAPGFKVGSMDIAPNTQRAHEGEEVSFRITFKSRVDASVVLEAEAREGLSIELSESEVIIEDGVAMVEAVVSAEEIGSYPFVMRAKGDSTSMSVRGVLVVVPEEAVVDSRVFVGQGFALTSDETKGHVLTLALLEQEDTLKGKLQVGGRTFLVDGEVNQAIESSSNFVAADIVSANGETEGTMDGTIQRYDGFLLFRGEATIEGNTYDLTAMSTQAQVRAAARGQLQQARVGDVLESEDIIINPKEVRRARFLGLIPYGKEKVKFDVIRNGTVIEVEAEEESKVEVDGTNITVGAVSEEEIEITVD